MSRSLYEEAIADAKSLKEVAEQNAKNAIIEAVTPRIRDFIEEQLLGESKEPGGDESEDVLSSVISESLSPTAKEKQVSEDDGLWQVREGSYCRTCFGIKRRRPNG